MLNTPAGQRTEIDPHDAVEVGPGGADDGEDRHGHPHHWGKGPRGERSFWNRNALTIVCASIFLVLLLAQSLTGWQADNDELVEHGEEAVSWLTYLGSGGFAEATFENWESEFLQMAAFVLLTVFLVQKGSPESKEEGHDERDDDPAEHRDDPDAPWPVRRGGIWLKLYENSLLIAFALLFLLSIVGHAVGGAAEHSEQQELHGEQPVSVAEYVTTDQFWFESFQNWQSEFLAVFSISFLAIWLRQRGSAESKPVYAPHHQTGD
jgi:hypothetical protein